MIRRHFLAGVVGLKAMCAAAALAVGVGQAAEAATYDVIFTITTAQHDYLDFDDGQKVTRTYLPEWWGVEVNTPMQGILEIGADAVASLVVNGRSFFGQADATQWQDAENSWTEGQGGVWYSYMTWTGAAGAWYHTADHRPDYYDVYADISLAPVPLPMTAALLPLGIGALALMRKRRRLA